jgi:hypothetical protein
VTDPVADLRRDYRPPFLSYLTHLDERGLSAAYDLGRGAMLRQLGLLELVRVHNEVYLEVVSEARTPAEALALAQAEWGRRQSVLAADAMSWALHVNGRDAEALEFSDKAAVLGWRNATFSFHRGMILAALGRGPEAHAALTEALSVNPYFSPLHGPIARAKLVELEGAR